MSAPMVTIVGKSRLYYVYPEVPSRTPKKGRAAIAVMQEYGPYDEVIVRVGYAFCSPKDQFVRKRGRLMARGRLTAQGALGSHFEAQFPSGSRSREVREVVTNMVLAMAPRWAER